jgi:hypothetical protein
MIKTDCKQCKFHCAPPPDEWYGMCMNPDSGYTWECPWEEECKCFQKKTTTSKKVEE